METATNIILAWLFALLEKENIQDSIYITLQKRK